MRGFDKRSGNGRALRIGVDIGGTFTDVTVVAEPNGDTFHLKVLSASTNPGQAVIDALDRAGIQLTDVSFLSHGSTIGINMVIERKGARTAIVATYGFRD